MYGRHASHLTPDYVAWTPRPPKPPNWRDFLPEALDQGPKTSSEPGEAAAPGGGGRGGQEGDGRTVSHPQHHSHHTTHQRGSGKTHKKKHRLHRTRSQFSIDDGDLPGQENMTQSLADTKPRELGLRKRTFDARLYIDENNRRCEKWLAGVKASEPLEDVAFAQGAGVEVEIPEENWDTAQMWGEQQQLKPPQNSSASSSDVEDFRLSPFSSRKRGSPHPSTPSPLSKHPLKPLDEGGGASSREGDVEEDLSDRSATKENRNPQPEVANDINLDLGSGAGVSDGAMLDSSQVAAEETGSAREVTDLSGETSEFQRLSCHMDQGEEGVS